MTGAPRKEHEDGRALDLKKFSAWVFFSGFVVGFVVDAVTRWAT